MARTLVASMLVLSVLLAGCSWGGLGIKRNPDETFNSTLPESPSDVIDTCDNPILLAAAFYAASNFTVDFRGHAVGIDVDGTSGGEDRDFQVVIRPAHEQMSIKTAWSDDAWDFPYFSHSFFESGLRRDLNPASGFHRAYEAFVTGYTSPDLYPELGAGMRFAEDWTRDYSSVNGACTQHLGQQVFRFDNAQGEMIVESTKPYRPLSLTVHNADHDYEVEYDHDPEAVELNFEARRQPVYLPWNDIPTDWSDDCATWFHAEIDEGGQWTQTGDVYVQLIQGYSIETAYESRLLWGLEEGVWHDFGGGHSFWWDDVNDDGYTTAGDTFAWCVSDADWQFRLWDDWASCPVNGFGC